MRKSILTIVGVLLILIGVSMPLMTTIVSFLLPEKFASTARVMMPTARPTTITAETARIQGSAILDQVIANLNLSAEWGRKFGRANDLSIGQCQSILKRSMRVLRSGNAPVIEIRVTSDRREEAAMIANELASAYIRATPGASAVERAQPNPKPFLPNKPLNIVLGLLLGGSIMVIGIALLIAARRTKHPQ